MLQADGRVVMVSGGSRGIGRAVVDRLLASGFTVSGGVRAAALCPGLVDTDMTAGADFPRDQMTRPADLAHLVDMLLRLPNTAVIAELLVTAGWNLRCNASL